MTTPPYGSRSVCDERGCFPSGIVASWTDVSETGTSITPDRALFPFERAPPPREEAGLSLTSSVAVDTSGSNICAYFGAGPRTTWTKAPGRIHFSNATLTSSAVSA
jgi:hypothetical protein